VRSRGIAAQDDANPPGLAGIDPENSFAAHPDIITDGHDHADAVPTTVRLWSDPVELRVALEAPVGSSAHVVLVCLGT
jgi:hypothetical protein